MWIPAESDFTLGAEAKAAAQRATKQGPIPDCRPYQAKSTAIRLAITKQQRGRVLPEDVGKFSKAMDTALPGKHTRDLYDKLKRKEASVLAQLRTGMTRLNGFLSRIGAAESDQCACGHARETAEHFLLRCVRWTALREDMLQCTTTRRGSAVRFKALVAGHESSSHGDQIRDGNREIGPRRRARTEPAAVKEIY